MMAETSENLTGVCGLFGYPPHGEQVPDLMEALEASLVEAREQREQRPPPYGDTNGGGDE